LTHRIDDTDPKVRVSADTDLISMLRAARTIAQKALAGRFYSEQVDGNDVIAVRVAVDEAIHKARACDSPTLIEALTYPLAEAIVAAADAVPALNVWYGSSTQSLRLLKRVDLGIAVDTPEGLMVPILRDVGARDQADLWAGLDTMKQDAKARNILPAEMRRDHFAVQFRCPRWRQTRPADSSPAAGRDHRRRTHRCKTGAERWQAGGAKSYAPVAVLLSPGGYRRRSGAFSCGADGRSSASVAAGVRCNVGNGLIEPVYRPYPIAVIFYRSFQP